MNKKQKKVLIRIIISTFFLLITNLFIKNNLFILILSIISYLVIGYDILRKAIRGIINLRPFDENFLMMVSTIGAIVLALYSKSYDFNEAIIVMLLYQ